MLGFWHRKVQLPPPIVLANATDVFFCSHNHNTNAPLHHYTCRTPAPLQPPHNTITTSPQPPCLSDLQRTAMWHSTFNLS